MITFELLNPQMTQGHLGLIPAMLSDDDSASAREQLDKNYAHGGGWFPYRGFRLGSDNSLHGPGDPPLRPLAQAKLRDELVVFYSYSWVAVIQPDRSFEVARMD